MTTDIKELVKLLRDRVETHGEWRCSAAADALEALAGEVDRLKTEAKTATTLLEAEKWSRAHVKSIIVSDLEKERDRLKAALMQIKAHGDGAGCNPAGLIEIARKALGDAS